MDLKSRRPLWAPWAARDLPFREFASMNLPSTPSGVWQWPAGWTRLPRGAACLPRTSIRAGFSSLWKQGEASRAPRESWVSLLTMHLVVSWPFVKIILVNINNCSSLSDMGLEIKWHIGQAHTFVNIYFNICIYHWASMAYTKTKLSVNGPLSC